MDKIILFPCEFSQKEIQKRIEKLFEVVNGKLEPKDKNIPVYIDYTSLLRP